MHDTALHTYALGVPSDGFFVMPILQLLPISHEKYLLLLIVGALKKKIKTVKEKERGNKFNNRDPEIALSVGAFGTD